MEFEWDERKAESNLAKHDLLFDDAINLFLDANRIDFDVSRATDYEVRRKSVGLIEGRLFSVVYTPRGSRLRVISARRANAHEERQYEARNA